MSKTKFNHCLGLVNFIHKKLISDINIIKSQKCNKRVNIKIYCVRNGQYKEHRVRFMPLRKNNIKNVIKTNNPRQNAFLVSRDQNHATSQNSASKLYSSS